MKNILVALDLEENFELLIAQGVQFAEKFGAKIWLLHVADPDPDFVGYEVGPQYIRDCRAAEMKDEHKALQKLSEQIKEKGIDAEGILIQGPTVEMIIEEVEKLAIALIVIGFREHGFFYETFFGGITSPLIKKSDVPLLVVPLKDN